MSEQQTAVVGYQYAPDTGRYIGPYEFPNNLDKEDIHLPPNTVLDAPPEAPAGKHPCYTDGAWTLRIESGATMRPVIDNYALLTEATVELMKAHGTWTAEDQAAREAATAGASDAN
ncbi:hypothetical protein [Uliginosibacterium sp. 31-12]|uniref:hypothetical protein n=1 Tax=Uliginosibacterium sp. 31-12 TaxID=3062781 RepID=UPI0026E2AC6C|nr:hypothetical protein [Uliginosibacterium sp. 31-12]MDO6385579.1 hypothetical protein [Uliginosibacterium sp. 31-12]